MRAETRVKRAGRQRSSYIASNIQDKRDKSKEKKVKKENRVQRLRASLGDTIQLLSLFRRLLLTLTNLYTQPPPHDHLIARGAWALGRGGWMGFTVFRSFSSLSVGSAMPRRTSW